MIGYLFSNFAEHKKIFKKKKIPNKDLEIIFFFLFIFFFLIFGFLRKKIKKFFSVVLIGFRSIWPMVMSYNFLVDPSYVHFGYAIYLMICIFLYLCSAFWWNLYIVWFCTYVQSIKHTIQYNCLYRIVCVRFGIVYISNIIYHHLWNFWCFLVDFIDFPEHY